MATEVKWQSPPHIWMWGCVAVGVMLVMCPTSVEAQPTIQANGLFVVGKEKTLGCYITSAETVNGFPLYWSKNGVTVAGINQEIVPVTTSVKSYNIFYRFTVTASDNLAVFTCTANFSSGSTSATWTVYAYKGPDTPVITGPSSVVSGVGSTWTCGVDGASNSAPSVFWQFGNNSRLSSDTFTTSSLIYTDSNQLEIHRETSTLTLTVTPGAPSFTLSCRAVHFDTSIETSADFPVTVFYPPQISGGNINYTATEGSTATLFCQINAYPIVTSVTWYKNGFRLDMTSGRISGGTALSPSLVFNNVQRSDAGYYMCGASNSQGTTNGTSNYLTIRYIPIITYSQNPISGLSGSDLTLSCNINSVPQYTTVFWHRVDALTGAKTQIIPRNNPAKYANGTATTTPALTIRSLDTGDVGLYRCVVDNNVGRGEGANLQVQVNSRPYKPRITGTQGSLSATEPQAVTLTCQVDALPALTSLRWVKDGQDVNAGDVTRYSGGTVGTPSLTIVSVGARDGGQYYCVAANSMGTTSGAVTTLSVDYFPVITTPNTVVAGLSGGSATLTVAVAANPTLTSVEWRKRDSASSTSYTVVQGTSAGQKYQGGTVGNPSLQIGGLSTSDNGYYTLVATNAVGTRQSSEFVLTVTSIPTTPTVTNLANTYLEGDLISLTCSSPSTTPSPSYRWLRVGGGGGGESIVQEGAVYTVASARAEDNGEVRCQAYNNLGSANVTVTLNVLYRPRASSALTNVTSALGETVTLNCPTQANPPASSFVWTRNGQVVGSSSSSSLFTVTITTSSDLGSYSCQATNDVGTSDPINVFVFQDSSGGANFGGGGNVGATTEDTGLSTATLVLIIIIVLIIVIVLVLILVYCCSKRQCFRKDNDVGPTHPPPPPPPVIPAKSYGYYNRGAVTQNGHISSIEKTPPTDTSNGFGHYNREPGLTISLPGGATPRPHHLPPLGQDGVPQEKESARSEDPHTETKKKKRRRRRQYDEESGSPTRHQHDPDTDI